MQFTPILMLLADAFSNPRFGWNLVADWNEMSQYSYMQHAFAAAAIVAILGGVVGWFVIVRSETYATHTLSMVGFPGATGAALLGLPVLAGYFVFCVAGAFAIPTLAGGNASRGHESAAVGSVQAMALALGLLFLSLDHAYLTGASSFLFGSFTGITGNDVIALIAVATAALLALAIMHRRLLFASVDPFTAEASGIRIRGIQITFLLLLGISVAEISQFTGALLAFTLLVTPAAVAQRITARPPFAMLIAAALGIVVSFTGLTAAFYSNYPVGFYVSTLAFVVYAISRLVNR